MTLADVAGALRWVFWGLCYVGVACVTILLLFPRQAPEWAKWLGLVSVVGLLGADARQKIGTRERMET